MKKRIDYKAETAATTDSKQISQTIFKQASKNTEIWLLKDEDKG